MSGTIDLQVDVVERTESQLLMHLVMTEFLISVPAFKQAVPVSSCTTAGRFGVPAWCVGNALAPRPCWLDSRPV